MIDHRPRAVGIRSDGTVSWAANRNIIPHPSAQQKSRREQWRRLVENTRSSADWNLLIAHRTNLRGHVGRVVWI